MKKLFYYLFLITILISSCKNDKTADSTENSTNSESEKRLEIKPISHATMVLNYGNETIYVDPTGGKLAFKNQKKPTIVLITDIHGDHYNLKTLKEIDLNGTIIVAPTAVIDKFPEDFKPMFKVLNNGESSVIKDISIEAVPMYNLREEALKFHSKGRGNGYVLTLDNERIYISGDTEDIPEMRALKNIDKAFVCMNLPYTMTVESAADAVLEFKPKQVYPYHYRGTGGLSDIRKFANIVNKADLEIEVVQLNWYPNL
ncbi:MBL fold metallo-hydrolase [Algibacter aquimarinus]|uniref:MBL fold metallo-hydrolase n=1 Tax=Algibacter aquimarinus TaxID=1136748 RepID=A0ABP9HG15_9FLAO